VGDERTYSEAEIGAALHCVEAGQREDPAVTPWALFSHLEGRCSCNGTPAPAPTPVQPVLVPEEDPPAPLGSIGLLADPMPMPRARARIAGKWPKVWVQFYEPKESLKRQEAFGDLWRRLEVPVEPAGRPLEMRAWFIFLRPGYHYGTGRNAGVVKPQHLHTRPGKGGGVSKDPAGGEHPTGGDVDNLLKLVKDGLSGAAYEDDGDVAIATGEKLYTDQAGVDSPRTVVEIWPLA